MSRVCIVGVMNIMHMSLISLYTKYLDDLKIPYDLIYLDKYGINEETTAQNHYCIKVKQYDKFGKISKLFSFYLFRGYAKKLIIRNQYQLVITWQATTAYILFDFLAIKYKHHYVVNIRDYIAEKNPIARTILKKLNRNAAFTTISSEGFFEFLPPASYVRVNSINEELIFCRKRPQRLQKDFYRIGFVGNCRFFRTCNYLIDALANDSRFEVWFCGTNSQVLAEYARLHNIMNVKTISTFAPSETIKIMSDFDMVNSAFGSDDIDNRTLMPIRLYTAVQLYIPLLVSSGTQLSKEVDGAGLGFSIDSFEDLADRLFQYLRNLDGELFADSCDSYLKKSKDENLVFFQRLKDLLNEIGIDKEYK